jgi:hypothetical protein
VKEEEGRAGRLPAKLLSRPLLLGLCLLQATFYLTFYRLPPLSDYIAIYTAGTLPLNQLYDVDAERAVQTAVIGSPYPTPGGLLPFNHPPFYVPVLYLITGDDYRASYVRWVALLLSLLCACGLIIYLLLVGQGWGKVGAALTAFAAALFYPAFLSILKGQDTMFLLLGALAWMWALMAGRDRLAGVALSLAMLKPHMALVLGLPMLFARRRAFVWFCAASAVLALYSLLLVGLGGALDLLHLIRLSAAGDGYGMNEDQMFNLVGLLRRFGLGAGPAHQFGWLFFLLCLFLLCVVWHRDRENLGARHFGLAAVTSVAASPHLHAHDLGLLLLPLVAVVVLAGRWRFAFALWACSLWLIVGLAAGAPRFAFVYALLVGLFITLGRVGKRHGLHPGRGGAREESV